MSGRSVEGLPWPEGDPDGLRRIAAHADALANELDMRHGMLIGVQPYGWSGNAQDAFAVSLADNSHAIASGARAMRSASQSLLSLAATVQDAQHTVLDAARKLKAARDAAAAAQTRAVQARVAANQQYSMNAPLLGPLAGVDPFGQQAENQAIQAENAAADAQSHALDVQQWAMHQATTANQDVDRADKSCASELEGLGLVQMPGSSQLVCLAPGPVTPLAALGTALFGSGASTDGTLKDLLSQPPPPPPPPPKPVHKSHSWWKLAAAGGLTVVTAGLTVLDAAQFGLDPVTDGATVATGTEAGALGTEAIAGEVITDAAASDVAAESAADVLAAEGAPSEGLAVEDVPATRPSWRDSEVDAAARHPDYQEQVTFKDGAEQDSYVKGSTRPDLYKDGSSLEVKNYNVETSSGRSNLVRNVGDQAVQRASHLPPGTVQSLEVDVRGQAVTPETLDEIASRIEARSGGAIKMENIEFIH